MECPNCRTQNPQSKIFCRECGDRLAFKCFCCGTEATLRDKFCGQCGQAIQPGLNAALAELSFNEKISRLERYLPEGLVKKILSQKGRIEGEKKYVTVMFCDMEGFTKLCECLGPEEVYGLMDDVYEILIRKVHQYEGTVNELTGDGIMALFGAPIAMEDAPQRAIRSALAVQGEITRYSEQLARGKGIPTIRMRIGIHSGPVVVGSLGHDLRVDFKAVGDTVNLASRMQNLAEAGTIYVSGETFRLSEGMFRFEALGERQIKGKTAPVAVYQVIAPSSRRTRFDVSAELGLVPFVGRDRESALLLDCYSRAKKGKGQVCSIIGEAGIGKSRFLYEFRKAVSNQDITFLEGKCLSYGKSNAYHPISDLLKGNFDIGDEDSDAVIRTKVMRGLEALNAVEEDTLPYLLELLAVKDSGIDKIPMSPEGRKERIVGAIKRIILQGTQVRPLVIAIEDLHWADKSTEEALRWILEIVPAARLLFIFTYRPGVLQTWDAHWQHNNIALNILSRNDSITIVSHLLGTDAIDTELQNLILSKTEGVPFFIEEFLKSLKDLGLVKMENGQAFLRGEPNSVAIPSTIQDMIMARVDRLPESAKALLQTGAMIERQFSYQLIKRISGIGESELLIDLEILKESELLYEQGNHPENIYIWRHAMTRDVVYNSILTKTRRQIHESIGNAIEQLHADKLDEHYGHLVNHFSASENYGKVAEYARLACLKAENDLSLHIASSYAMQRVHALEKLQAPGRLLHEIIKARTTLGFLQFRVSNMADAKESIEPIADAFLEQDLKIEQGQAWVIMGSFKYMVEEDVVESIQYLEKAIAITEKTQDVITSVYAQYMLGLVLAFNCDFEKAIHYFDILLNLSESLAYAWRISVMKSNLSIYGYNYHGMVAEGYRSSHDAVHIAEKSGDIYSKAMAYSSHGVSCYFKGLLTEAQRHLEMGADYTEKIKMTAHNALAHEYLGHVFLQQRRYRKAGEHYERTIGIRERSRLFPSSANLNRIALARARCLSGEKVADIGRICRYAQENRVKIYDGTVARYIGEIMLHAGEQSIPLAEFWIKRAIQSDSLNGMRCNLGWDYALYGDFFLKSNKPGKAKHCMEKAIDIFTICGADGWTRKLEKQLSETQMGTSGHPI